MRINNIEFGTVVEFPVHVGCGNPICVTRLPKVAVDQAGFSFQNAKCSLKEGNFLLTIPALHNGPTHLKGWFGLRHRLAMACMVLFWCAAFLAVQCRALPIRDALGMIESGDDDHAVGSAGEISRYQIKKNIWRAYSSSSNYWDKNEAWRIAEKVLATRIGDYQRQTGHAPTSFDIYVLWNAPGQFQNVGYRQERISRVVAKRAARFGNLVQLLESSEMIARSRKPEKALPVAHRPEVTPQLAVAITGPN